MGLPNWKLVCAKVVSENNFPQTLIVDLSDNFGGANARILALMKNLPRDLIGLATIDGSMIARELEEAGYQVHRMGNNKFDPRIPFRMAKVIRKFGYKVVDTQNPQSKLWGSIASTLAGVSLISTLNSWYMNEHPRYSPRWFIYTTIELLTNINLSRYIVVSKEIKTAIVHLGVPVDKVDLVYNAIDLDLMNIPDHRKAIMDHYHFPEDAIICAAAGRLVWAKGHDELIRAFEILAKEDRRLVCIVAGEGDLQKSLEAQIVDSGLSGRFVLAGHMTRADVLSLIKSADIFVMPSRTEGTPVALLEAAALKKPILATHVGGIPELITNDQDGVLVPSGNIEAMAEGLRRLVRNLEFASRLAENANQKVSNQFALNSQVLFTIQSYNKAWQSDRLH